MGLFGSGVGSMFWRTPKRDALAANMSSRPIWVSCWTKGPASGTGQGLGLFASDVTNKAVAGTYLGGLNEFNAFDYSDALAVAQAASPNGSNIAGKWQFVVGQFISTSLRSIYVDTVANTDATSLSPPQTLNSFQVGMCPNDGCLAANRLVAEVAFGRGILTAPQLAAMQAGQNPMAVVPSQILAYFPLRGDLSDSGPLRMGLTRVGGATTIWGEHPPVALPPRRRLLRSGGVVVPPPTVRPRIRMVA